MRLAGGGLVGRSVAWNWRGTLPRHLILPAGVCEAKYAGGGRRAGALAASQSSCRPLPTLNCTHPTGRPCLPAPAGAQVTGKEEVHSQFPMLPSVVIDMASWVCPF